MIVSSLDKGIIRLFIRTQHGLIMHEDIPPRALNHKVRFYDSYTAQIMRQIKMYETDGVIIVDKTSIDNILAHKEIRDDIVSEHIEENVDFIENEINITMKKNDIQLSSPMEISIQKADNTNTQDNNKNKKNKNKKNNNKNRNKG